MLDARCPACGAKLVVHVDMSEGPPLEVGEECDCGAIPIWELKWWIECELDLSDNLKKEMQRVVAGLPLIQGKGRKEPVLVHCSSLSNEK